MMNFLKRGNHDVATVQLSLPLTFAVIGYVLLQLDAVSSCAIPITLQEKLIDRVRETRSAESVSRQELDKALFDTYALETLAREVAERAANEELKKQADNVRISKDRPGSEFQYGATRPSRTVANASSNPTSAHPKIEEALVQLTLTVQDFADLQENPEFNVSASGSDAASAPAGDYYEDPNRDAVFISSAVHSGSQDYGDEDAGGQGTSQDSPDYGFENIVNSTNADFTQQTVGFFPTVDKESLRETLTTVFNTPRNDNSGRKGLKDKVRSTIIQRFLSYGLHTWVHNFTAGDFVTIFSRPVSPHLRGVTIVGTLAGTLRGQPKDGIILVGAHYDTVSLSNGVDDNGSGMAVLMEVAKALTEAKCQLQHTVIFVAFDLEEQGGYGSYYFVNEYLIPQEIQANKSHFQGAYILDTVLNYDQTTFSQEMPRDFRRALPRLVRTIAANKHRGDFLAMISRKNVDSRLTSAMGQAWSQLPSNNYKLYNMAASLPAHFPSNRVLAGNLNFLRSDHFMFWYHNHQDYKETLNAVLLTDTGPFRGIMKRCYHTFCDNITNLATDSNISFAKKTADSLLAAILKLGEGRCPGKS